MPSDVADLVRSGYAEVRFAPTYEEVTSRRRRRRPVTLITAIAVLLVSLGAGVVVRAGVAAPPNWLETFPADCDRVWSELARDNPALTPQHQEIKPPSDHVFAFHNDLFGLRLYVFDPVLFACSRSGTGVVTGSILGRSRDNVSFLPEPGDDTLNFLAAAGVRPEYIIGRVPSDTTSIEASTPDGYLTATIDKGFFAIWKPFGGGLAEATVVAARSVGGTLIGRAAVLVGDPAGIAPAFIRTCEDKVRDGLRRALGQEEVNLDSRLFVQDGDWALMAYSSGRVMTHCELNDGGIVNAATNIYHADGGQFAPLSGMFAVDERLVFTGGEWRPVRNWAVVAVPTGTERGEFVFPDGRSFPGQVSGGLMVGLWPGAGAGMPIIRAYTVDTVYEKLVDKPVTTRPR